MINASCPIPISQFDKVTLAHGGGGKLSQQLVQNIIFHYLGNDILNVGHDGAMFEISGKRLAFTTDSYVVQPIFFAGGDIGELAVNGTVNDLVCCGAKPLYLSLAFILEEGFLLQDFEKVVISIKNAANKANVKIVTGDTKVVDRGKGDQIFINTSGIGIIDDDLHISPTNAQTGDVIIVNGNIADHGITIMSTRAGLEFETQITSDTAALNGLMQHVFETTKNIHVLRDPTRGGLASSLNEIAQASSKGITIFEDKIPLIEETKAACELLGFDPLYVANEGKILVFVPENEAAKILEVMQQHPLGTNAAIIGKVTSENTGMVRLKTQIGSHRIVDMISGEQLPRIC